MARSSVYGELGKRTAGASAASCASECSSSDSGASALFRNQRPQAHETPSSSSRMPLATASRGQSASS